MAEIQVSSDGGPVKLGPKNIVPSYTTTQREALDPVTPGEIVLDLTTGTLWFVDDAGGWQELSVEP